MAGDNDGNDPKIRPKPPSRKLGSHEIIRNIAWMGKVVKTAIRFNQGEGGIIAQEWISA